MKKNKKLLNEEVNVNEIIKMIKNSKPIFWEKDKEELLDFYNVAKVLKLNHIIYLIDASGELNSVWATSEKDIVECFYTFSNKCYFGRVQNVDDAIEYGFFDEFKTSNHNELSIQDKACRYDTQEEAFERLKASLNEDFVWDSFDEINFWMKEFIRDQESDKDWVNSAINIIGHDYYITKAWFKTQTKREEFWSKTSFDLINMIANSFD